MRISRTVVALALAPLVALGAFEAFVWTHRTDLPPIDDSDLASTWRPVPDDANGRIALLDAARTIELSEEVVKKLRELQSRDAWDPEIARAALDPNAALFAAIDAAIRAPHFQRPWLPSPPLAVQEAEADLRDIGHLDDVPWLCGTRAIDTAHERGSPEAIDEALRCFRLAQRIASMPGVGVMDVLEARLDQTLASTALRLALPRIAVSADDSRRREAQLDGLRLGFAAWDGLWAESYRYTSAMFSFAVEEDDRARVRRWLVPLDYAIQPNRSRLRLAEAAREMRAAARRTCAEPAHLDVRTTWASSEWLPAKENERWMGLWIALELERHGLRPNGYADWIVDLTTGGWEKLGGLHCHSDTIVGAAQALVALRAYQLEHGALPPALDALVPRYLARVPLDAFDGAPLRYAADRKLLWSIGSDLRDDGGVAPKGTKSPSVEPSWRILF